MHISLLLMNQIIQLFIMIFMGFIIVKAKLLKAEDSKILSVIVLYLIIPCVIINAFQVDYTPQTVKGLLIALAGSVMTQVILLIVVSRFFAGMVFGIFYFALKACGCCVLLLGWLSVSMGLLTGRL